MSHSCQEELPLQYGMDTLNPSSLMDLENFDLDSSSESSGYDSDSNNLLSLLRLPFFADRDMYDMDTLMALFNEPSGKHPVPNHVLETFPIVQIDKNLLDQYESCVICHENFSLNENVTMLFCNHFYHADCINQWFREKNMCPICRRNVYEENGDIDSSTTDNENLPTLGRVARDRNERLPSLESLTTDYNESRPILRRITTDYNESRPILRRINTSDTITNVLEISLNELSRKHPVPNHVLDTFPIYKNLLDQYESCVICHENFSLNENVTLFCNHFFHADCIFQWFREQNMCPICKTNVYEENGDIGSSTTDNENLPALGRVAMYRNENYPP